MSTNIDRKLTPQQVENWRRVLHGMIGPYALIMSPEEIEALRDKIEQGAPEEVEEQLCNCCGKPRNKCCAGPD